MYSGSAFRWVNVHENEIACSVNHCTSSSSHTNCVDDYPPGVGCGGVGVPCEVVVGVVVVGGNVAGGPPGKGVNAAGTIPGGPPKGSTTAVRKDVPGGVVYI